jgi:hypothetical protein
MELIEPGALSMDSHCFVNLQGSRESCVAIFRRDARLRPRADRMQERLNFKPQGLALNNRGLVQGQAGGHLPRERRGSHRTSGNINDQQVFSGIVDRDILARLEEAKFAHALGADPAGGEVGHATGFKFEADICDVDLFREDRQSDGMNVADGRPHHAQDNIEVVNHEIEDHINVERARGEDAETMGLKEHGAMEEGQSGEHGWIEAFEVADLQNAVALSGQPDKRRSFAERGGDGLFEENIDIRIEQCGRYLEVSRRRNADRGSVKMEIARAQGGKAFLDGGKDAERCIGPDLLEGGGIGIDHCRHGHGLPGGRDLAIDAKMVAPEGPQSKDCHVEVLIAAQISR